MRSSIAALMILVSCSAFSQSDWVQFERGENGDKYYMRSGSLHTAGQYKRVWSLWDYHKPGKDGDRSVISLTEYNCNTRQHRVLQSTFYKSQMGRGATGESSITPSDWKYVIPGSVGETALEVACGN
jgi:hypothetical protein